MTLGYTPKVSDIKFLPKALQRKPEIRALTLSVYPGDGDRHFKVPGSSGIHDVFRLHDGFKCSCKAGSTGRVCAHAIAAKLYCERQKEEERQ